MVVWRVTSLSIIVVAGAILVGCGTANVGFTGKLVGDADERCAWIETRDDAVPIVLPAGYSMRFEPLRLVQGADAVIAEAGDRIDTGGHFGRGIGDVGRSPVCDLPGREAFYITEDIRRLE